MQIETLQALRIVFGFPSYYTCYLTVHEREDLSHRSTAGKEELPLATGSCLYDDKVGGVDKRLEN